MKVMPPARKATLIGTWRCCAGQNALLGSEAVRVCALPHIAQPSIPP